MAAVVLLEVSGDRDAAYHKVQSVLAAAKLMPRSGFWFDEALGAFVSDNPNVIKAFQGTGNGVTDEGSADATASA